MRLSEEALAVAERAAEALGITRDYFLDELLRHEAERLDQDGRPTWWKKSVPRDQKELPLKSA
jgi:hypothetical protein